MKIFYQIQSNDCGVAIIKSLIQHFYKTDVPYPMIFARAQINQNGINLINFENLNDFFGLKVDSYECTFDEFLTLPDKKYYVILRKNEQYFHYCIIYKVSNKHIVYDPNDKIRVFKNQDLAEVFTGIILTIEKKWKSFDEKKFANELLGDEKQLFKNLLKTNWKEILLSVFLSLITIVLTIFNSQVFKFILSEVIIPNQLQNLAVTYLFFILSIILETLLSFVLKFLEEKVTWKIYEKMNHDLEQKLENSIRFFGRIDENIIFQMPSCIHSIAQYTTSISTSLINEIIFCTILIFLLPKISVYFLITFAIMLLFDLILDSVCYWWSQENKWEAQKIADDQIKAWKNFTDYLKAEHDQTKYQSIHNFWKTNFDEQNQFFQETNFFNNKVGSTRRFIQSSFNLFNLVLGSILIVKFSKITLPDLLSGTFILGFFMTYCSGISKSIFSFNFFRVQALRYLNCIYLKAKHEHGIEQWPVQINEVSLHGLAWTEPEIEHWKSKNYQIRNDTVIFGQNGIGKTTLCQTLANRIMLTSGEILVNGKSIYDYEKFDDNVILLNSKSPLNTATYLKMLQHLPTLDRSDSKKIVSYLTRYHLLKDENLDSLSSGERQILNWLYLITCQNKLIICDEALNYIQHEQKIALLEITKPIITKQNFLMVIEHDQSIKNLFQNELQLHQI